MNEYRYRKMTMGKSRTTTLNCTVKNRDIHRAGSDIVDRTDLNEKGEGEVDCAREGQGKYSQ